MAFPYPYTGPIAYLNNLPINPQYYEPRVYFIETITLGATTTVTTTVDHDYVIGQLCRLIIPPQNGCIQLNESQGIVIQIPSSDQVVLNIDSSRNVSQFQTSSAKTQPQILPIGDYNEGAINSQGRINNITFIPGSFINISPE
jgi:hypothetical protein